MNLAPTDMPWVDVLAVTGICIWMVAIGAPLARAAFGNRARTVWPCYAPIIGIAIVLATTNLLAYAMPGAAAAWVGLIVPSVVATAVTWRGGMLAQMSRRSGASLASLAFASAGLFVFALANRTQVWFVDETWHFPLALRMARGVFPPTTPYGPDAGIGYHYGSDLLAASTISTTGVPVWTAFYVLMSFLVVVLILAAAGFARQMGAPLPLAAGIGAAVALFSGRFVIGLPPYVDQPDPAGGLAAFLTGLAPAQDAHPDTRLAFSWLDQPQRALAVSIVILIAAAFESPVKGRQALVLAVGGGVLALTESAALIFAAAALTLVGALRLVRLHKRDRLLLAAALTVSALLIVFAGGPISDAILGRGGTTGMVRIDPDLRRADLLPFELAGPALLQVGVIPLMVLTAVAALRWRSWGLGYLSAAAFLGLVEAQTLHSALAVNDKRIIWLTTAVAMLAGLSVAGRLVGSLRAPTQALLAAGIGLFAILPTALPRAISGTQLASEGVEIGYPVMRSSELAQNRTQLGEELAKNWDFYAWLARSLPQDARLLTTHPSVIASTTGVTTPTSGSRLQVLSPILTPVYEDALRFLNRNDMADMGITHLHVTDALEESLSPPARGLLKDPMHFRPIVDMRSVSGTRHRIFKVMSGAGAADTMPASYRRLREIVQSNVPVSLVGTLSLYERRMVLFTLVDHDDLRAPAAPRPTFVDRATRIPSFQQVSDIPDEGIIVLPQFLEPGITLGLSPGDAIWAGYGMRAYSVPQATWSPVWRIGQETAGLPDDLTYACKWRDNQQISLRVLGEPEDKVMLGSNEIEMTGVPQVVQLPARECNELEFAAHASIAPFAQIRATDPAGREQNSNSAGLGFDGGRDGDRAVVNLWYRNPLGLPFAAGTEFRLYQTDSTGMYPRDPRSDPHLQRWTSSLILAPDTQMARVEFHAMRLEINGEAGRDDVSQLIPGATYLLTLNIAGAVPTRGYVEIQQIVPLVRFVFDHQGVSYEVFSGIVDIESHELGTRSAPPVRDGWLSRELDFTPR